MSSVSDWEGVLRSNIWDLSIDDSKIIPALLLSYYHLPSHLKRCFAYCALFPKDYKFDKENLILLWMAENFLQCSQQSKSPEEVEEQYFNDLLSRFGVDREQRVPKSIFHFLIVKDHLSTGKDRVYYDEYKILYDTKRLRTFMSTTRNSLEPDSVGNFIHLRSLDLSNTDIRKHPDSIGSLCNLQVLKLNACFYLMELPSTLHELTNLRRLEFMRTCLRKAPVLLGKLKKLRVQMNKFEVGKSSEFSIQQLGELHLRGELSIRKCIEVLENLQPSRHLKQLVINCYGGTKFPRWLSDNSLTNVVSLALNHSKYCLFLPSLGLLTFLKHLTIDGLDQIVRIDADFYGNSSSAFASL
ncbi:hypothetical protein V8G54_024087 [Vigna mungo]|uniref:Disease resistance RPP13-like protein 1 n=1 Tax=Vigna mungo TaxID=3915 RepID=A0AAQ3N649_VIGMU